MNINAKIELDKRDNHDLINNSSCDYNLEGLRGFAAFSVALAHVFDVKNFLDPTYHPNIYFSYLQVGHSAVLLFFLLSGYVIGLVTKKDFSTQQVQNYILRRGVRILPIYLISISLGVLAEPNENFKIILGNLFFLQNFDQYFSFFLPPIAGNGAVWSLNYEVLYYLAFILVWRLNPKVFDTFIGIFIVSAIGCFFPSFPQFIAGYASGWIFWLSGLLLSWKIQPSTKEEQEESCFPLFSYILLFHATNHLLTGKYILNALDFFNPFSSQVNLSDLTILPICILIISEITRRYFYGFIYLRLFSFLIPIFHLIWIICQRGIFLEPKLVASSLFIVLALLLLKYKISGDILKKLNFMGRISYAFYLLHTPIAIFMYKYFPWQGTVLSFSLGLLIWLCITILLSAFLELVMQPRIKQYYLG